MGSAKSEKKQNRDKKKQYDFLEELREALLKIITVDKKGNVVLKKSDLKKTLEEVFLQASKQAAKGNKIRFPVLGILSMKEIPARKAGKQRNPFTGEMVDVPARPASRKPKWSFPKALKVLFADKKNWK